MPADLYADARARIERLHGYHPALSFCRALDCIKALVERQEYGHFPTCPEYAENRGEARPNWDLCQCTHAAADAALRAWLEVTK